MILSHSLTETESNMPDPSHVSIRSFLTVPIGTAAAAVA